MAPSSNPAIEIEAVHDDGAITVRRGLDRPAGHASIARALRHASRDPARAFRLLTGRK